MLNLIMGLLMTMFSYSLPQNSIQTIPVQDTIKIFTVLGTFTENGRYECNSTTTLEGRPVLIKTFLIIEIKPDTIRPGYKKY